MSTNILGNSEALRKFWSGPHTDLMIKLTGENGPEYEAELNRFLRKQPCWEKNQHVIDCDVTPFVPDQQQLVKHKKAGQFEWNSSNIELFQPICEPKEEKNYPIIEQIEPLLTEKLVCNANIMDYLLRFQHLIPDEWKDYDIYFFGTRYRFASWRNVRYLRWHGVNWEWDMSCQIDDWHKKSVTATFHAFGIDFSKPL